MVSKLYSMPGCPVSPETEIEQLNLMVGLGGQWVNVNDAYYRWELSRPADGQLTRGKNEDARS